MTAPEDIRASDADRQRVADALSRYAGEGRLTLDELTDRLGEIYTAKTVGQLGAEDGPLREMPTLSPPLWHPGPPTVWQDPQRLGAVPTSWPDRDTSRPVRIAPLMPWLIIVAIVGVAIGASRWGGDKAFWLLVLVVFCLRRAFGHHHRHPRR